MSLEENIKISSNVTNSKNNPPLQNIEDPKIKVKVSAPGKIIIHGEHSVVYNKLALAGSISLRTTCRVNEQTSNFATIILPNLNMNFDIDFLDLCNFLFSPIECDDTKNLNWQHFDNLDHPKIVENVLIFCNSLQNYDSLIPNQRKALISLLFLLKGILGSLKIDLKSFAIIIDSELNLGAGTGSSASFSVALAGCLVHLIKKKFSTPEFLNFNISSEKYKNFVFENMDLNNFSDVELDVISKWGYNAEKIIHGTPSGIDNTICTYGSLVKFRKGTTPETIKLSKNIKILLVDTKISRNTKQLVEKVANFRERHTKIIDNVLNSMDQLTIDAIDIIQKIDASQSETELNEFYGSLSELTEINQGLLSILGVSHPSLDKICDILRNFELRGKLTGAGGGGYAICILSPFVGDEIIKNVQKELLANNFTSNILILGGPGVKIEN